MSAGCCSTAADQESKTIFQAGRELLGTQQLEPGGSELDRQRDAIQLTTDVGDKRDIWLREPKVGRGRRCAVDEEVDSLVLGQALHIRG